MITNSETLTKHNWSECFNKTQTNIISLFGDYYSTSISEYSKNVSFLSLNKKLIFDEIISIQLSRHAYYHVVFIVKEVSANLKVKSLSDYVRLYLKCDVYYNCSFEFSIVVLNASCTINSDCIIESLNRTLNLVYLNNKFSSNLLFNDDSILFAIDGELGLLKNIFYNLLDYFYSSKLLRVYTNFDILLVDDNSYQVYNQNETYERKNFTVEVCDWFSNQYLNHANMLNQSYSLSHRIREIYYLKKETNGFNICPKNGFLGDVLMQLNSFDFTDDFVSK
jgi:hypothetical protein